VKSIGIVAAMLLAVAEAAVYPYSVDLLQYTGYNPAGGFVQGNYGANGATGIDVFGWSSTGNVAYMIDGGCEGFRGGFCYNIIVSSMVSDRVLFTLRIDSEDYDDEKTFEQIYALKKKEIAAALEKHEIVERKADFLKFPIKTSDAEYKCHLNQIKKDGDKITDYNVVIVKNGKEAKKISSVSKSYADTVLVLGYFLSPFEPTRMLVVTATNSQFEGNNFGISFNGCDLTKGFNVNEKLAKEVADEEWEIANRAKLAKDAAKAKETASYFTDARDGKKYRAVQIGSKKWMAQNLNYQPQMGLSWCYNDDNSLCNQYGRLYDWATARKACPTGWHLPARWEWDNLGQAIGGKKIAGKKLKSSNGWNNNGNGTDDYGFSALPGGSRFFDGFGNVGTFGNWWTVDEESRENAHDRNMIYREDYVGSEYNDKSYGRSVRCVSN
jgi:uncharacterized protein (TIGR02145 family)